MEYDISQKLLSVIIKFGNPVVRIEYSPRKINYRNGLEDKQFNKLILIKNKS